MAEHDLEKGTQHEPAESPPSSPVSQKDEHDLELAPPEAGEASSVDDHDSATKHGQVLERSTTNVSTRSRPVSVVSRSKRRGFLGRLTIVPEVVEPRDYSRKVKWTLTAIVALAAAAAPMGSAIILPALVDITEALNTTPTIANFSAAFYMLSMSIFPLWWSSFSETAGRRTIYLISFALFMLWNILSAVSTSIGMFVVMRVLSGGASASVQAVGAGTIADLWEPKERGRAMGMFYLGPLLGPFLAPIFGGALTEGLGWRSTLWFLTIFGGLVWLGILFCLPETLKARKPIAAEAEKTAAEQAPGRSSAPGERPGLARVTTAQSVQIKTRKWLLMLRRFFIDPLKIILYLRFPAVAITVYYASITFGVLYFLNISIQDTFSRAPYNFSTIIVGLLYIPNSVGYILASIFGGKWVDTIMIREARRKGRVDEHGKPKYIPEDRMKENAWFAAVMFPGALIWYGWTVEKHVHWVVPMIANFFFGVGSMLIFAMATTMLTEFMPRKASNGVAVNNFIRNIFSFIGAVTAEPLIRAIGNGWLFTGLGVIALVSGVGVIWSMKTFGERWRVKMDRELD